MSNNGAWSGVGGNPREWQRDALPKVMGAIAEGIRGVVVACTGSGKSVLIAEVCAQQLDRDPNGAIVILTPTTRLVEQLAETMQARLGPGVVGRYYTHKKQHTRKVIVCCNASAVSLARKMGERRVSLAVADEAHRSEADQMKVGIDEMKPDNLVGFTATPFRASDKESLQLFDALLYSYSLPRAVKDGVVLPWQVIPWSRQDAVSLDDACIEMLRPWVERGRIAINASTIPDSEAFAERLTLEGIKALAIHSELAKSDQDARLELLRTGDIKAVVYPSLLQEGADFPWLRTLLLRRKVGSSVRFIQEVGRVLRIDRDNPEKEFGTVLDPNGLFLEFDLKGTEAIGETAEEAEEADRREQMQRDLSEPMAPEDVLVKPVEAVSVWTQALYSAADVDGVIHASDKGAFFSDSPATAPQLRYLGSLAAYAGGLPEEHAALLRKVIATQAIPSGGCAVRLISILKGLRGGRRWRPTIPVWVPDVDVQAASVAMDDGDVSCCGVRGKNGYTAIVVQRGRRVIFEQVRPSSPYDDGWSPAVYAAVKAAQMCPDEPVMVSHRMIAQLLMGYARPKDEGVKVIFDKYDERPKSVKVESKCPAKAVAFARLRRAGVNR